MNYVGVACQLVQSVKKANANQNIIYVGIAQLVRDVRKISMTRKNLTLAFHVPTKVFILHSLKSKARMDSEVRISVFSFFNKGCPYF
jgi:hypothetical protein